MKGSPIRTPGRRLLPLLFVLVGAASACGPSAPREIPFPKLDSKTLFPGSLPGVPTTSTPSDGEPEDEIARLMRDSVPPTDAEPATHGMQSVMVAGHLVGELPLRFEEWRWATDGDVTLAVHFQDGRPDALIYAEAFGPVARSRPTEETQRFYGTIDPGLASPWAVLGSLVGLAARAAIALIDDYPGKGSLSEIATLAVGFKAAMTRTGGQGFGYRSMPGSFSGWRWVGRSSQELDFRLARTSGVWGTQPNSFAQIVAPLVSHFSFLQPIVDFFERPALATSGETGARSESPAWMVVGNVAIRDEIGVHIALLCAQEPDCGVTPDFVRFIETLRAPSRATARIAEGSGAVASLPELAEAARLRVAPKKLFVGPDSLIQLAKAAAAKNAPDAEPVAPADTSESVPTTTEESEDTTTPP